MRSFFKASIIIVVGLLLCGCGNKENIDINNSSNSGTSDYSDEKVREKLVDKSVVPKKLNFDFSVEGTKKVNLFVKDEKVNNLEIPVVDPKYDGKLFGDFSVNKSNGSGINNNYAWYIKDGNGNTFSVVAYMYGLTGAFKGKSASEVVDGYKPEYPLADGGESSFFRERYESTFNSFIKSHSDITDGLGNHSGEIILLDSATMINNTYSLSTMSFRYGTTPQKYSKSSIQGYRKVFRFEQQLTDYMRLLLFVTQEYSGKASQDYDEATAMSIEKTEEIINNDHLNEIFTTILKMYDCYDQYQETLNKGTEFKELFEENKDN